MSPIQRFLQSTDPSPLTVVSSELQDRQSTVIRGVITLTWPHNRFKQVLAFGIADPNNRAGGYVRLQIRGSAAQTVDNAKPRAGDGVLLCLEGADIEKVDGVWNVTLAKRVLLQVSADVNVFRDRCLLGNKSLKNC